MVTVTLRQLLITSATIGEAKLAANWLDALPRRERDAVKAHLRSFSPSQCTTMGIAKYWKLTVKGTTP